MGDIGHVGMRKRMVFLIIILFDVGRPLFYSSKAPSDKSQLRIISRQGKRYLCPACKEAGITGKPVLASK